MAGYHIKKVFFNKNLILSLLFFCSAANSMDAPIAQGADMRRFDKLLAIVWFLLPRLSLQDIGRFACVCAKTQRYSFDKVCGNISPYSVCFKDLARDDYYDKCTELLAGLFKQKNPVMFKCVYDCHETRRQREIHSMLPGDLDKFSSEMYRGMYYNSFNKIQKEQQRVHKNMARSEKQQKSAVKQALRYHRDGGGLLQLYKSGMDIADVFPKKKESELIDYLCRDAWIADTFIPVARKYIMAFPAQVAACLLEYKKFGIMIHLIEHKYVDVNARCKSGKTMLHHLNCKCGCHLMDGLFAKHHRCPDPVYYAQILIENGANVNAVDNKGMTPLHYACKKVHLKTVMSLLQCPDIDPLRKNNKGRTPQYYIDHVSSCFDDFKRDKGLIQVALSSRFPEQRNCFIPVTI